MFNFLFGTLGSVIFWVTFFAISLFAGTFFLKRFAPKSYEAVTTGKLPYLCGDDWCPVVITVFLIYIFWPIILICYCIGFVVKILLLRPFQKAIIFADKNMPNISVGKKN